MKAGETNPPVVLVIRDGWGENPNPAHDSFNAVKLARTPLDHRLRSRYPHTLIKTSGEDVGLPKGTMGNSEVGHQNIGAGRIVDQEVMRITRAVRDGSFFENSALVGALEHARSRNSNLHIMGLLSDGQVHADLEHLLALIDLALKRKFPGDRVFLHLFTDGRDTGPRRGLGFLEQVEAKLRAAGVGRIASIIGRYYAMDRDHRWERIAAAYAALTGRVPPPSQGGGQREGVGPARSNTSPPPRSSPSEGKGISVAHSAREAIQAYYDNPTEPSRSGDEFITPSRIIDGTTNTFLPAIDDGDAVIFFNFRGDRPRQLTKAFMLPEEQWREVKNGGFDRGERIQNLYFCTMTGYEEGLPVTAIAFHKPPKMKNILGDVVARAGLTQFRCAETEKFAHVTFFFNDYREQPFEGERRLLCPSPKDVATYDQKPEMSANDVCDAVIARLRASDCEALIVVNFANPDMVGHTGSLEATIKAVETVDACVGRIVDAALGRGGSLIVTADHGNAEQMWSPEEQSPHTSHTTYDVPLIVVGEKLAGMKLRSGGRLADIAPTVLAMMGLSKPPEMTGTSLLP
jgi:2,3-bisphosphoglycerate-independent phosphoglycerate mutase